MTQRVAIVTGASRGIGRALALGLARAGHAVVVAAKSTVSTDKLPGSVFTIASEIEAAGGRCLTCLTCVTRTRLSPWWRVRAGKHPAVWLLLPPMEETEAKLLARPMSQWVLAVPQPVSTTEHKGILGISLTLIGASASR